MIGPHAHAHAHDETLDAAPGATGPWSWPCPRCATENLVRELPAPADTAVEVRCDYCGAVSEFAFSSDAGPTRDSG